MFDFLDKCQDKPKHGIYCDQPFPGPGDKYKHRFDDKKAAMLADDQNQVTDRIAVCTGSQSASGSHTGARCFQTMQAIRWAF